MKKGDFIEVKPGVKDPDFEDVDLSGWTGVVSEVFPPHKKGGPKTIEIKWDMATLNKLPKATIRGAIEEGYAFDTMNLHDSDLLLKKDGLLDDAAERQALVHQLEEEEADAGYGEEEKRISAILESNKILVNPERLEKYRAHLLAQLDLPVEVRTAEALGWEERFLLGVGNKEEFAALRKTQPSSGDIFELLDIPKYDELQEELLAYVKRRSDGMNFNIPLSYLKTTDASKAELLRTYGFWIVNYR